MPETSRLKKITGVLLVSAVAVGTIGVAPRLPALMPGDAALADAVSIPAPQAPDFADVVEAVTPAVVSVRVESDLGAAPSDRSFRFDRRFGDNFSVPPRLRDHPFFRDGPRDDERRYGRDGDEEREYGRRDRDGDRRYGRRDGEEREYGRRDRDGDRRYGRKDDDGDRRQERRRHRYGMSQGSGFFVSGDGYVVTNHHVIENGSKFTVVTGDGTEYEAKLVGADSRTDLAVLKVESDEEFTYVKFAEGEPRVGQWVVAIGNPFGLGGTVTAGIVSAHNRAIRTNRYDDLIQIDAAVNKGNSGGPAFNLKGEVIGVNNVIFSPNGGNVGIAFAIPANAAEEVVGDLIDNGQVVRGWLGVRIQPVTADIAESVGLDAEGGAIVTEPQDDSPADDAGIRAGDVITMVDGVKVDNPRELARKIAGYEPDSKVSVTVWRDGESRDIEVTLGKLDEGVLAGAAQGDKQESDVARVGLALESGPDGVVVVDVEAGSGAEEKNMRAGDVILSVNGEEVSDPRDVAKIVREADDLDRKAALFQIRRGDDVSFVAIPIRRG